MTIPFAWARTWHPARNAFAAFRVDWWEVPGRDEQWKQDTIRELGAVRFASEHGNSFIGSQATIISAEVLKVMKSQEPLEERDIRGGIEKIFENKNRK